MRERLREGHIMYWREVDGGNLCMSKCIWRGGGQRWILQDVVSSMMGHGC